MLSLPRREGPTPVIGEQPPQLQHSDLSPAPILETLNHYMFNDFDHVTEVPSQISVPQARAMWLNEDIKAAHDAFMPTPNSREFAHTHPDGSMHLIVSNDDIKEILEKNWGALHPWHGTKGNKEIMIFAPRDKAELEIVKNIVKASYEYALSKGDE